MSSVTNNNKNQEQTQNVSVRNVEVVPHFTNEVESFDNPESFPDLEFVVRGMKPHLRLHRKILANASKFIKDALIDKPDHTFVWPFEVNKQVDQEALIKALRFCYGETMSVGAING